MPHHVSPLRFILTALRTVRPLLRRALQLALPNQCGLCGSASADTLLCQPCIQKHIQPQYRCEQCGLKMINAHSTHCGTCLAHPPAFDRTWVAFDYHAPWDAAIGALKFGHRLPYAQLLAQAWSQQFSRAALPQIEVLLPAPLARQRLRERGFNQALEIAKHMAQSHTPIIDHTSLVKVRDTPPQVGLSHQERLRNVRGAFSCVTDLKDKHVAVLDDVMTSGATLGEIASTLKHAGAASVTNIVIARTPKFD